MNPNLSLDRLHEMLEEIPIDLELIVQTKDKGEEQIGPYQLPFLSDACQDVFGFWSAYGREIPRSLTMPKKLINNFIKDFDDVHVDEAIMIAERLISYLKSIEGQIAANELSSEPRLPVEPRVSPHDIRKDNLVEAFKNDDVGWILLDRSDEVGTIIAELSGLLERIIRTAKMTNLPPNARSFSELEMAQIIAVLETALAMLKAPLVEKGLLKKAAEELSEVGKRTAKKKSEIALGKLADLAFKAIVKLVMAAGTKVQF